MFTCSISSILLLISSVDSSAEDAAELEDNAFFLLTCSRKFVVMRLLNIALLGKFYFLSFASIFSF